MKIASDKKMGACPQRRLSVVLWRVLKWTVITLSIGSVVAVVWFGGLTDYLSEDICDHTMPSPVVRNRQGDMAEGHVQVCTLFGTVVISYVTMQIHQPTRTWPKRDLIDFDPAGPGHPPKLRWIDDNTLSVDLGKVYWVSSHINRLGNIHIIYIYSMVASPPLDDLGLLWSR